MNAEPGPVLCAACGRVFTTVQEVQACATCLNTFCTAHAMVRNGVATCAGCEEGRRNLDGRGVSDADEARVVQLLSRDLVSTVGAGHQHVVEDAAARMRLCCDDASEFEQRVVDEVQQVLHDTFVDTVWPRCPSHPNHPLRYALPSWICEKEGTVCASLGTLSPRRPAKTD